MNVKIVRATDAVLVGDYLIVKIEDTEEEELWN